MAEEVHTVDVGDSPEVARLAGRVRASGSPLFLEEGGEIVAVLVPVGDPEPRRRRARSYTPEDDAAFLSFAGGWKGSVDVDRFLEDNAESRRISTRPAPEL